MPDADRSKRRAFERMPEVQMSEFGVQPVDHDPEALAQALTVRGWTQDHSCWRSPDADDIGVYGIVAAGRKIKACLTCGHCGIFEKDYCVKCRMKGHPLRSSQD